MRRELLPLRFMSVRCVDVRRVTLRSFITLSACLLSSQAFAFDYLEHLYLTDASCQEARQRLTQELDEPQLSAELKAQLSARALALSLSCPDLSAHPNLKPYCAEGFKLATASLTPLERPPQESGDYSLTLGDLAALPDHIAAYGKTPHLERAQKEGLTTHTLLWLTQREGGVDGTLEDVAEDACEGSGLADWVGVREDLRASFSGSFHAQGEAQAGAQGEAQGGAQAEGERAQPPQQLPRAYLRARSRAPLLKGPSDPAGLYSFDNPHYLDLVFRNHHHFGEQAYSAWLGFHSVSVDLASAPCESLLDDDADLLEELSEAWPPFHEVEWGALDSATRRAEGCHLLSHVLKDRLTRWFKGLSEEEQARWVKRTPALGALSAPTEAHTTSLEEQTLLKALSSALLSLIYQGSGLHFLQDSLAGGHMRTIRTRGGLQEARYDHDEDNQHGVIARYQSASGVSTFVAYGDSYLLSYGPKGSAEREPCAPPLSSARGARCALQLQRGLLARATAASLLDWAHGGLLFEGEARAASERTLAFVRGALPVAPPSIATQAIKGSHTHISTLARSNLPVPPPEFSYQALSYTWGFDLRGSAPRLGAQLSLLDTLGEFAHWLTSYRFGLTIDLGEGDRSRWTGSFGYAFHFRWAARFTLDMGALGYVGWREFTPQKDLDFYTGIKPIVGFTLLPEGWLKMPLELSVSYQLPLTFYDQGQGFPGAQLIEGHYLNIGLGLAFMR